MNTSRIIAGFLTAPLAPCILFVIFTQSLTSLFFSIPISYFSALVVGAPTFYILSKYYKVNFLITVTSGFVAAVIPVFTYIIVNRGLTEKLLDSSNLIGGLFFGAFGILAGASFWFIALKE